MAVEIESMLFCANVVDGGPGGGVTLHGVFGVTDEMRSVRFQVFASLRGDRGRYAIRLALEDRDGRAVRSLDHAMTFDSDMGWGYFAASFTID